jgi:hypothetical protein
MTVVVRRPHEHQRSGRPNTQLGSVPTDRADREVDDQAKEATA